MPTFNHPQTREHSAHGLLVLMGWLGNYASYTDREGRKHRFYQDKPEGIEPNYYRDAEINRAYHRATCEYDVAAMLGYDKNGRCHP